MIRAGRLHSLSELAGGNEAIRRIASAINTTIY